MAPIFSFVHHGALHLHHPILLVKGSYGVKGLQNRWQEQTCTLLDAETEVGGEWLEQRAEPAYVNAQ